MAFLRGVLVGALLVSSSALAESATTIYSLADADDLRPNGVAVAASEFQGRASVEVRMLNDLSGGDSNTLAIVEGTDFQDGVIEFDVASRVNPDSWFFVRWIARGFVGIAFRTDADLSRFELSISGQPTGERRTRSAACTRCSTSRIPSTTLDAFAKRRPASTKHRQRSVPMSGSE